MPDQQNRIGKYTQPMPDGRELVRYATNGRYTAEQLEAQRRDFENEARAGKLICLSDLFINHGF